MSLHVENGILWGVHNHGIHSVYCTDLRENELTLSGGRFSAFTTERQPYVVAVIRSRAKVSEGLDWIEEYEAGTWSFIDTMTGGEFSFSDHVTAIQFKLTLMDTAH